MKDKLFAGFFIFMIVALFALPILVEYSYVFEDMNLNPNDYARITDVEYKAVVVDEPNSEGKVVITERLTFDIHAASENNLFWELWRDLPEDYVDGVKVDYKVNSVKQIYPDGREVVYEESPKLYWDDSDYLSSSYLYGPEKWYHSEGPYDEYNEQYECVFFYVDGLYREEVVFEIEYEMHNAALRYRDCSDLYLALYSGDTIKYLESFKVEILFPNEDMPSEGNYKVFTYGTNAHNFPVEESATANPGYYTFSFELDEEDLKFKPYNEYIEFDLVSYGKDRHIFTEYAPSNHYSYDNVLEEVIAEQRAYAIQPLLFLIIKTVILIFAVVALAFVLIDAFTYKGRMQKKHYFYTPAVDLDYFRDIPSNLDPNFAAALVFSKHKAPKDDSCIYSAVLLSLARKEYIALKEYENNNVVISITKPLYTPQQAAMMPGQESFAPTMEQAIPYKQYEPLTPCEEYYFNLLIRHSGGTPILMSQFQSRVSADYNYTDSFVRHMNNSIVNIGVREGYFQKADYSEPRKKANGHATLFLVLGIILITIVNIIFYQTRIDLAFGAFFYLGIACLFNGIYIKIQAKKFVLLTQFGEDEYEKWRGLYNFLNSDTLIHERTFVELPMWEKYLIYATAFGLSEKVIKAISLRCPEVSSSQLLSNNYYRSGRIHRSSRSFRSAVRSGSSTARSGGGGGFGYGGGGRGGGGGGGGH